MFYATLDSATRLDLYRKMAVARAFGETMAPLLEGTYHESCPGPRFPIEMAQPAGARAYRTISG